MVLGLLTLLMVNIVSPVFSYSSIDASVSSSEFTQAKTELAQNGLQLQKLNFDDNNKVIEYTVTKKVSRTQTVTASYYWDTVTNSVVVNAEVSENGKLSSSTMLLDIIEDDDQHTVLRIIDTLTGKTTTYDSSVGTALGAQNAMTRAGVDTGAGGGAVVLPSIGEIFNGAKVVRYVVGGIYHNEKSATSTANKSTSKTSSKTKTASKAKVSVVTRAKQVKAKPAVIVKQYVTTARPSVSTRIYGGNSAMVVYGRAPARSQVAVTGPHGTTAITRANGSGHFSITLRNIGTGNKYYFQVNGVDTSRTITTWSSVATITAHAKKKSRSHAPKLTTHGIYGDNRDYVIKGTAAARAKVTIRVKHNGKQHVYHTTATASGRFTKALPRTFNGTTYRMIATAPDTLSVNHTNSKIRSIKVRAKTKRISKFPTLKPVNWQKNVTLTGTAKPHAKIIVRWPGHKKITGEANSKGVFKIPLKHVGMWDNIDIFVVNDATRTIEYVKSKGVDVKKTGKAYEDAYVKDAPNRSVSELDENLPDGWTMDNNGGRVHIKDPKSPSTNKISKKYRIRIDPADSETPYQHIHLYDKNGNPLDGKGTAVMRKNGKGEWVPDFKNSRIHIKYSKKVGK